MNKELREVINNAKESTLKHDGYGKLIIQDKDGSYSFSRKYDGYSLFDGEKSSVKLSHIGKMVV